MKVNSYPLYTYFFSLGQDCRESCGEYYFSSSSRISPTMGAIESYWTVSLRIIINV